jgi:hypothetical protein
MINFSKLKELDDMNLLVEKSATCDKFLCIDYNNIPNISLSEKDVFSYNEIFSKIVSEHAHLDKYLISPTLTRIETQTNFFDKLMKFIRFVETIESTSDNILFKNIDFLVFKALKDYLKNEKIKHRYDLTKELFNELVLYFLFPFKLLQHTIREFTVMMYAKLKFQKFSSKTYEYAFFSFYDNRAVKNQVHSDPYFTSFVDFCASKNKKSVIFYGLIGWKNFGEIMHFIKNMITMQKKVDVVTYHVFLSIKDFFSVIARGLGSRLKLTTPIIFKGKDITYLTNCSLAHDYFFGRNWFFTYSFYYFAKNILKEFNIKCFFYPFENHPWEKLFVLLRNKISPSTRLKAFQHSSISFKLLNYFPGSYEKEIPFYPDKIFTIGEIIKDIMDGYGHYPSGLIDTGCALRASYLFEPLKVKEKKMFTKKTAFAFSSDFKTYPSIIKGLIAIFAKTEYTVYLKIHPIVDLRHVDRINFPPNFIMAKYMPWKKIYEDIDILFYDGNTIGAEALRYNITVAYLNLSGQAYNTDHLFYYSGTKFILNSVEDCKMFLKNYYNSDPQKIWSESFDVNNSYLSKFFNPVTEEFMEKFCS